MIRTPILKSLFIAVLLAAGVKNHTSVNNDGTEVFNGFAVVELFTSEGCSSCPPADEILTQIANDYRAQVYVLGFHVDYWDRLGWKDVFSNSAYSKRQEQYAAAFHLNSVYTPQALVNGKKQFVGSDNNKLDKAIEEELRTSLNSGIEISAKAEAPNIVRIAFKVKPVKGLLLNLALVQLHAETHVKSGENKGRFLRHINVVRDFKILPVQQSDRGEVLLQLPAGLTKDSFHVIAYTQAASSMHILSCARATIQ